MEVPTGTRYSYSLYLRAKPLFGPPHFRLGANSSLFTPAMHSEWCSTLKALDRFPLQVSAPPDFLHTRVSRSCTQTNCLTSRAASQNYLAGPGWEMLRYDSMLPRKSGLISSYIGGHCNLAGIRVFRDFQAGFLGRLDCGCGRPWFLLFCCRQRHYVYSSGTPKKKKSNHMPR